MHKAQIVRKSVEGHVTEQVPASILQDHPDCTFFMDTAAAMELTRNKSPWLTGEIDWTEKLIRKAVCTMALEEGKPLLMLTNEDYNNHGLSDLLVRHGGTAILSETPEIYGAEHLLTRRAVSREVGEKLVRRIKWWEEYTERLGGEMNNNPSPGNKAGGLTTILEKSLGAVAKGGTSALVDVYEYAQRVTAKGFVFMDTPGYDPVSATGQVAGGANIICFTTGRGSAYGCKPSPSLKLATNSALFQRQEEDMDINCGVIVDGKASIEEVGRQFFDLIVKTASGTPTKSEQWGYGEDEFAPWVLGPTM
jgi:altronate hydrolase